MDLRIRTSRLVGRTASIFLLLLLSSLGAIQALALSDPPIPTGDIRIHYFRPDGNYSGWTIYAFDNTTENTGGYGTGPVTVTGTDSYGVYFDVGVTNGAQEVGIRLSPWLTQPVKTMFAVRCDILDRQDHFSAF